MKERHYVFTPYPRWMHMPDAITETCECGEHNRTWTLAQLMQAWKDKKWLYPQTTSR